MPELTLGEHRDNLADLAVHAAALLRDASELNLTAEDLYRVSLYLEERGNEAVGMWDARVKEQRRRAS